MSLRVPVLQLEPQTSRPEFAAWVLAMEVLAMEVLAMDSAPGTETIYSCRVSLEFLAFD